MQQHVNTPLPVRLAAMPGNDHYDRARHALEAIRLRAAAQLAQEEHDTATGELYGRLNSRERIEDYTPTVVTSGADFAAAMAAVGILVTVHRPRRLRRLVARRPR